MVSFKGKRYRIIYLSKTDKLIGNIAAKHIAYDGYKDVGYQYVNIDDCWMQRERDSKGKLVPNPDLFPNGMDVSYMLNHLSDNLELNSETLILFML